MILYRARWIVPVSTPPIENGLMAVEGGSILWVGSEDRPIPKDVSDAAIHDLHECLLLPGFVNAHTHLELTCYRGELSGGSLWHWLEELIVLRSEEGAMQRERLAVEEGISISLAAGVTCVGDISRSGLNAGACHHSSRPIRMISFVELISGASGPPNDMASLSTHFSELRAQYASDRLTIGLSPHALYSVTESDLMAAAGLARSCDAPLTLHLLETAEEMEWLSEGRGWLADFLRRHELPNRTVKPGDRPFDWLDRCRILSRSSLLAHVNYATDEQLDRLASSPVTVVWCPRAHRFFGHRTHRWREMLAKGINVCVGTDSAASDATLSVLDELRHVRAAAPEVSPGLLVEMGTLRGAAGLGLDGKIGSLEAGKRADFVSVPLDSNGSPDPLVNLLDGEQEVSRVWIEGLAV